MSYFKLTHGVVQSSVRKGVSKLLSKSVLSLWRYTLPACYIQPCLWLGRGVFSEDDFAASPLGSDAQ